ncbi:hypothetical protein QFC22_001824 [Naganishia vaughanmartiniae]|uniref:Uncharacterized protein n=1 Tax=Naganishia vaughanmartiniae TaxID=1424756 RepID=A0ACC2XG87_9TREE|nr:hypothetical protein QFC22_001824 [Naganishia vaughanmartiniae]
MADQLTPNAVSTVFFADPPIDASTLQPTLQILNIKKIQAAANSMDRYRLIMSDGQHYLQAMLGTQLNNLVESNALTKNGLITLTSYATNVVQGRRLLIILGATASPGPAERIGTPVNVDDRAAATETNDAKPNPVPQQQQQQPQQAAPQIQSARTVAPAAARGGAAAGRGGRGGGRAGGGAPSGPLYPIEGLSPYQNKWTIKARVAHKSDIKHYSNQRGEGKLFNVTLMDETGEIRATGFNEAVDNFYETLQEGKVYFLSRARVNIAKKQFSNVNNDYEIMLDQNTEIEPCDDESVPQIKYNFVSIEGLANVEKDQTCDVLAVVKDVGELGQITSKSNGRPFSKRDITLVDQSQWSVRLTLWGKQAETFTAADDSPVIAFKGVKVGDFGGRSLSMFSSSTMTVNPDIGEAHSLRGWFDAEGNSVSYQNYSNAGGAGVGAAVTSIRPEEMKTIGQIKDENIGMSDKQEYFSTKATVSFIKQESFSYPACPTCNKKVTEDSDGWRCEKCDAVYPQPVHRYILNLSVMDHSGHIWITAFNEAAESIVGKTANELVEMKEVDEAQSAAIFQLALGKTYLFQCSAKQDSYNDQMRIRYSVRRAAEIDYKTEAHNLIKLIDQMQI